MFAQLVSAERRSETPLIFSSNPMCSMEADRQLEDRSWPRLQARFLDTLWEYAERGKSQMK